MEHICIVVSFVVWSFPAKSSLRVFPLSEQKQWMSRQDTRLPVVITHIPLKKTKATVVLLHELFYDGSSFNSLSDELAQLGCKVVVPSAPLRRLHWDSSNPHTEARSWYDYYTKRDGKDEHDVINVRHLEKECEYILDIINEHHTTGKLILGGISQGGTLVYHMVAKGMISNLSCAIVSRSCFLHDLVPIPFNQNITLLVFTAQADEVYDQRLSERSLLHLVTNNNIRLLKKQQSGLRHGSKSRAESKIVLEFVKLQLSS